MNPGFFFEIRDSYSLNNRLISRLTDKFAPFTAVSHFATFNFEMSGPGFAFYRCNPNDLGSVSKQDGL